VTSRDLIEPYASLAAPGGIRLYGSGDALRGLAGLVSQDSDAEAVLATPPPEVVEVLALRAVRILPTDDGPIELRANDDVVEVSGGAEARRQLAETFENLACTPYESSAVPKHVDLEYFPGDSFLSENSMWMTVYLLPALSV